MISLDPVPQFPLGRPQLSLGEVVVTAGAATKISSKDIVDAVSRHAQGDWGILEPEDRRMNDERVEKGGTVASIFKDSSGVTFYILTEADRSVTTVLLPDEF